MRVYQICHAVFVKGVEWEYREGIYLASTFEKAMEYIKYVESSVTDDMVEKLSDHIWRIEYDYDFRYFIEYVEIDKPLDKL